MQGRKPKMNLSEALLHALREQGAREIFGIPGDYALPFFKVIEESGILPFLRAIEAVLII
jgi:thiamine pyrophosphate-dependent acetolactate synthase large subunit-like protein